MFIRRKTYNAIVADIDTWKELAEKLVGVAESFQRNGSRWQDIAISCQEDNRRLVAHEEEMLTKMKELETELQGVRRDNQRWTEDFEELDLAYGRLDTDYNKLREERDHYEERCRYLEGEVEDKEELEAKLDFAIKQRDYYYDLLESTSDAYEEGKTISGEAE